MKNGRSYALWLQITIMCRVGWGNHCKTHVRGIAQATINPQVPQVDALPLELSLLSGPLVTGWAIAKVWVQRPLVLVGYKKPCNNDMVSVPLRGITNGHRDLKNLGWRATRFGQETPHRIHETLNPWQMEEANLKNWCIDMEHVEGWRTIRRPPGIPL